MFHFLLTYQTKKEKTQVTTQKTTNRLLLYKYEAINHSITLDLLKSRIKSKQKFKIFLMAS